MREVTLKFETEELYQKFINDIITPQLNENNDKLLFNFETNIAIIKE